MSFPAPGLEHESAPMVRALLWKEWREQQPVVAAGMGLTLLIPLLGFAFGLVAESSAYLRYHAQLVPFLMATFVWPVFAAACAATANAERDANGGADFLLSLPASRAWVWRTKVIAALAALAAIILCSYAVSKLVETITIERLSYDYFIWARLPYDDRISGYALEPMVYGVTVAAFCGSFFFSMLTRRPLGAALAGLLLAIPIAGAGLFVASALVADQYRPDGVETFLNRYFASAAAGLLTAAYLLFRARSASTVRAKRLPVVLGVGAALMIAPLGTMVSAVLATTPDKSITRRAVFVDTVPTHALALAHLTHDGMAGGSFWVFGPQRSIKRVTPGKTRTASIVPGDQWIAYDTRAGRLGLRRDACSLRMVRIDGSDDRLVHEPVPCDVPRVFSADGSRIALFSSLRSIMVLSLDGSREPQHLDVIGPLTAELTPLWWINGGIVLEGRDSIHVIDVATGAVHAILDDEGDYSIRRHLGVDPTVRQAQAGGRFLVRARVRDKPGHTLLLGPSTGSAHQTLPYCPARERTSAFSGDGRHLFWVDCGDDGKGSLSRLWVRDMEDGAQSALITAHGWIGEVNPSPSGNYVLVSTHVPASAWSKWDPNLIQRILQSFRTATARERDVIAWWTSRRDRIILEAIPRILLVERGGPVRDLTYSLGYGPPKFDMHGRPSSPEWSGPNPPWQYAGWFDDSTLALQRVRYLSGSRGRQHQFAYLDVSGDGAVVVMLAVEEGG